MKARDGSTNSLRSIQRPVTAKTSSSGKNSTTSRQSNRSKKEGSAESQRKTGDLLIITSRYIFYLLFRYFIY